MRFPRSAKILRSQFDVAPFAAVFFCLLLFLLLGTMMPVPGLRVNLEPPAASDLPGITGPAVSVAVDSQGRLYYKNKIVTEQELTEGLTDAVHEIAGTPTLVIHADKAVSYDKLVQLMQLARSVGITNSLLATLPRLSDTPVKP